MITSYMITASIRDAGSPENDSTKTYCKDAVGFVDDGNIIDCVLSESEANAIYAASSADGLPYSIISKISVDENGMTAVIDEKTSN